MLLSEPMSDALSSPDPSAVPCPSPVRPVWVQAPAAVVMVRPARFHPNPQTAADNSFQRQAAAGDSALALADAAYAECTRAADTLRQHGVLL